MIAGNIVTRTTAKSITYWDYVYLWFCEKRIFLITKQSNWKLPKTCKTQNTCQFTCDLIKISILNLPKGNRISMQHFPWIFPWISYPTYLEIDCLASYEPVNTVQTNASVTLQLGLKFLSLLSRVRGKFLRHRFKWRSWVEELSTASYCPLVMVSKLNVQPQYRPKRQLHGRSLWSSDKVDDLNHIVTGSWGKLWRLCAEWNS